MQACSRNIRVLLIAEAANPEWASVPLGGWSLSRAIADITQAHIATHVRNRDAFLRAGLVEGRDFTCIDNDRIAAPLYRLSQRLRGGTGKGWTTVMAFSSLAYYSFEHELWRQFGPRLRAREFDLVHRITPKSPTSASLISTRLHRLGIPFVLGPLGGGLRWPKGFTDRQHSEREWLSHVRNLYKLLPYYRPTLKYAAAIIAGSKYNFDDLPAWASARRVYIPGNGVDLKRFPIARSRVAKLPLKAAFVGRLVPYKGADILLEAAVEYLRNGQLELDIIGDGPQRSGLEAIVAKYGIAGAVRFHGWLPHVEVENRLRDCDFIALPSIREFGGAVVVEAMALGVTPIVADYGGPPEFIDDNTGIRVGFTDKKSLVAGMTRAIDDVICSPATLDTLGAAARIKVRDRLTWEAKARQIVAVYQAVLSGERELASLNYVD